MPFQSSKKSNHSQSYRVLIFSGEIITNKTYNHGECAARFHIPTKRTCKCASYLSDGVKLSNSTTFLQYYFSLFFQLSTLFIKNQRPISKMCHDDPLSFAFIYHPTKNRGSSTPFVASYCGQLLLGSNSPSFDYSIDRGLLTSATVWGVLQRVMPKSKCRPLSIILLALAEYIKTPQRL